MRIPFTKMHGAGNDLVLIDCLAGDPVDDWGSFARFALDRRLGVGGDQLLLVQPSSRADFAMGIRNPDGSRAEMCANGIRAFFKYVRDRGLTDRDEIRVETLAGIVTPRWLGNNRVEVRMTPPVLEPEKVPTSLRAADGGSGPVLEVPLEIDGEEFLVSAISMGNPHCVVFVDDPDRVEIERFGPRLESHPAFPAGANVEFAAVRSRSAIAQRTWERGTGETLACGSGACAVTVAAVLTGRTERCVEIELRGGALELRWPEADGPVFMTGPAAHVFDGELLVP